MKRATIRIDKLSVRLRGVTPREARERGAAIARQVADAVARQAAARPTARVDRLTLRAPAVFERQIQRQWTEK